MKADKNFGKLITVLEDNEYLGDMLKIAFESRGFRALHATGREQLFELLDNEESAPAVAVVDMNLEEEKTGAEVAQELRRRFQGDTPEFIIYSAYDYHDYYKAAFRLGAAIYLNKTDDDYQVIITTARVLAIRRAIRNCAAAIHNVVANCENISQAFYQVTTQLLVPAMNAYLGARFTMLLADADQVYTFGGDFTLPREHTFWHSLKEAMTDFRPPSYLDMASWLASWDTAPDLPDEALQTAAVVPLYQKDDLQLSLILADGSHERGSMDEHARSLAENIGTHFRADLVENFFTTTHVMAETAIRRREQLDAGALFCFKVGDMLKNLYQQAIDRKEIKTDALVLPQFQTLGQNLRHVGNLWESIREETGHMHRLDLFQLIQEIQDELRQGQHPPHFEVFNTPCYVLGHQQSLKRAIRRLIFWMDERRDAYPDGQDPTIIIDTHILTSGMHQITFQDRSTPIPEPMMHQLLLPFNGGSRRTDLTDQVRLYEAKLLIEIKNAGKLSARSTADQQGNQFDISLLSA